MLRAGRDAYEQIRAYAIVAAQAGLAAGLAWFVAHDVLHNQQPLFAPAASIGTIAAAIGNRIRRTVELITGVFLGVLIGQLIIQAIGTGPVQAGLIVALAISSAAVIRGNGAVMVHAGSTAVLLATLTPTGAHLAVPRTINALIGGAIAVVVALLILPLNPVRVVHRSAGPTLNIFANELSAIAKALNERDVQQAEEAQKRLAVAEEARNQTTAMVAAAREVVILSPWRRRRLALMRRYEHASAHLQTAYANSLEMAHWAVTALQQREPLPAGLSASIEHLGQGVRLLHRDFLAGHEPDRARARTHQAVSYVDEAGAEGLEFAGKACASRLRLAISELLQAAGTPKAQANLEAGLPTEAT